MPAASAWSCPKQQAPAVSPVDLLLALGLPTMLPSQLPLWASAHCSTGSFLLFVSPSSSQAYLSLIMCFSLGKIIYSHISNDQKLQEGRSLLGSLPHLWTLEQCLAHSKWTILSPCMSTLPHLSVHTQEPYHYRKVKHVFSISPCSYLICIPWVGPSQGIFLCI